MGLDRWSSFDVLGCCVFGSLLLVRMLCLTVGVDCGGLVVLMLVIVWLW